MSEAKIVIAGGGLAGVEAAHQAAKAGMTVRLYEMRPGSMSPAHSTGDLGELVCSNSLKSDSMENASGILKEEMRRLGSLVIEAADRTRVPAGKALAVDRVKFAAYITEKIEGNPLIELVREEFTEIPENLTRPHIIATGPLTSEALSERIRKISDGSDLYFYDAISPIVDAESIDYSKVFRASRYEDGETEEGDYLNCALNSDEYYRLVEELTNAEKIETGIQSRGGYSG